MAGIAVLADPRHMTSFFYYLWEDIQRLLKIGDYAPHRTCGVPRSPLWAQTKRIYWQTHEKVCSVHGGTKNIQLHHKHPFHVHPELENDQNNLIAVCEEPGWNCHLKFAHLGNFRTKWNPNIEEDAALWLPRFQAKAEQEVFPNEIETSV